MKVKSVEKTSKPRSVLQLETSLISEQKNIDRRLIGSKLGAPRSTNCSKTCDCHFQKTSSNPQADCHGWALICGGKTA
jgi:hypothetical protein